REARAAAALNHPNIAHVYEIDEAHVDGDSRPFIAMEFIDGETLDERIAKGPLALKDALSIAAQVAKGLRVAHEKDIVHRDVKSGNVMLTSAGVPKILDFGLAKTAASTKLTQMGSTLGTVAYMSPEQARGEEVDQRSDVWSLGVILYELVSGRMPFAGDYEQAVVYGILNSEPEPLTGLRTGVPMELERIVGKCLVKDPARRYQSTTDLIVDLEALEVDVRGNTSRHSVAAAPPTTVATEAPTARSMNRGVLIAAVAAALVIGVVAGVVLGPSEPAPRTPMHLSIMSPEDSGLSHPSMSPDGRYVAYSASGGKLVLHDLSTDMRRTVVANADARISRFSPDGRWLAFEHGGSGISILQVPDGAVARLSEDGQVPSWIDSEYLIFTDGVSIFRTSRITQQKEVVWEPGSDDITGLTHPEVLPGGDELLVTVLREPVHGIGVLDVSSGEIRMLRDRAIAPRFVSSGHLIFTDQQLGLTYRGRVFAQPFDVETGQTRGPAVPILTERGYWE
ncbi:MAG: protein kinase, partial [Rhodothermales bacterium]|nr:protein kinase [Rhodothermales bacterium]